MQEHFNEAENRFIEKTIFRHMKQESLPVEEEEQIARAGRRILGFHVCDWLVPTVDLIWDRGMMGDGVIDIPRIRG